MPAKVRGEDYLHIEYEKNVRMQVHFDAPLKNIELVARSPSRPRSPHPHPQSRQHQKLKERMQEKKEKPQTEEHADA